MLPLLSWSLLPSFNERDVRISWETAPGTSLPETRRIMTQVSKELELIPGISNVTAHIGRAVTGDQVADVESGQLWVNIDPDASYGTTLAAIRETVQGYPGFDSEVQGYLTAKVEEGLTGAGDPIVVSIQGPEQEGLRREAEKVAQILSGIEGIANLRVENPVETPHVAIKVDLAAAGRVGLKPGDIRRAAATVFGGLEVGNLYEQQKVFEVVVWGIPESRQSLTDLRELLIDTPTGGRVRLADVAEVVVEPTPAIIDRQGFALHADIRADVAGRDLGSVVGDVEEQLQAMEFPLEYHAVLLGDYAEGQAAYRQTSIAALAAAIGIYLLLQACLQSWLLASLFYVSLLGALAGGVLAIARGRRHRLPRLACRVARGARRSGAPRHLVGQHLPVSRAARGGSPRSGACPARRAAAVRTHRNERDSHRRHLLAPAVLGRHRRARDRASDGRGHSGWPHHLGDREPVRGSRTLLGLRETSGTCRPIRG